MNSRLQQMSKQLDDAKRDIERLTRIAHSLVEYLRQVENAHHPLSDQRKVVKDIRETIEGELYGE